MDYPMSLDDAVDAKRWRTLLRVADEITVKVGIISLTVRPAPATAKLLAALLEGAREVTDSPEC